MRRALILAGLLLVMLPAPARADDPPGGFEANATTTPIKIELFEPTIPMPSDPQAELDIAYTVTKASSGPSARGRSSWLWPGDAVGEGLKVIGDTMGLPAALTEKGYTVQVNSQTPGDPETQSQEPAPGVVMRSSSDPRRTVAIASYAATGTGGSEESDSKVLSSLQAGDLTALGDALTGPSTSSPGTGSPEASAIPPGLSALVDAQNISSVSRSDYAEATVVSTATSKISGLSLLGGVVTADTVKVVTQTTSNLDKATTRTTTRYEGLTVAGREMHVGPRGVEAAEGPSSSPGLPDDIGATLEQLGISFVVPKAKRAVNASKAELHVEGLQVVIDTRVLRSQLDTSALSGLFDQLPDEMGQLKSVLGGLNQLAPKLVITLGTATSTTDAVPGIDLPPVLDTGDGDGGGPAGSGSASGGTQSGAGAGSSGGVPSDATAADSAGPEESADAIAKTAGGLPPLGSVPTLLFFGGLALAAVLGRWLRQMGLLALGGSKACHHGLVTGVPDLRKV